MDPFDTTHPEETPPSSIGKKWVYVLIGAVVFLILAVLAFYIIVVMGNGSVGEGLRNILPFGGTSSDATGSDSTGGNGKLGDIDIPIGSAGRSRMWKIADGPVSGAVVRRGVDGGQGVRYVMREDGDIYEYDLAERRGAVLANNAVPRVAEAIWDARGQSVVLRTTNLGGNIVSMLGKLAPNTATGTGDEAPAILIQEALPEGIAFLYAGPEDGYVHTLPEGNALSIVTLRTSGEVEKVFTSPFSEWIPEWPRDDRVVVATRPSGGVEGYLFRVDTNTGRIDPVVSGINGLTARTAPNGTAALIGGADEEEMTLMSTSLDSPSLTPITPATLPEKCAWTASSTIAYCGVPQSPPRELYPDSWYQGVVQFSDTIWQYSLEAGLFTLLAVPKNEGGEEVDIVNPIVSADSVYLIFTNKINGSLWGFELSLPIPPSDTSQES